MFKIVHQGKRGVQTRALSETVLTPENFHGVAAELGISPVKARKIGFVAARRAEKQERIETRSNGKETTNTARPGDLIVTNLSPQREPLRDCDNYLNVYVIAAAKFADLYQPTGESNPHGAVYRATGTVSAIALPGGFDIAAPWGERQSAADGFLVCNGGEVYGVSRDAFDATYEVVER